ncbi:sugar transferase [Methylobacterium dankookense]|uniref:Sugar transferase EpsL n=1 Tax=Methylobacterium dankookense TaxID=560405 RepID=A0A564FXW1_9HYPH|nr:sugar transferase [Methylobacterium dankookense]GJD54710.1 putative sugar transferase EpsL [Methylobacterium dankookense]VUF12578.1 putative sugar transferase EpsL [Methylobacterium dankookense]
MLRKLSAQTSSTDASVPRLQTFTALDPSHALRVKRALDLTVAVTAMVVLGVLILMIAAAILVMQGRPILIRHPRIGRGGATFPCLKFRTMVNDADAALSRHLAADPAAMLEWKATHKLRDDPRVTPLGRILRQTSLDELPQFINILRGEMSLVGPRPIVAAEIPRYGGGIVEYKSVRPGLTGLWQCSGRNDVSYERRVLLDREYVRTWSLAGDIRIMLKTVPAVLNSRGVY